MFKKSSLILLVLGLIFSFVGAYFAVQMITGYTKPVKAWVTQTELQAFTIVHADQVKQQDIPESSLPQDAVISPNEVKEMYLRTVLPSGTVLRKSHFVAIGGGSPLAQQLTEMKDGNLRAFPVPVDKITGLNGAIAENDRVDVTAAVKIPLTATGNQQPVAKIIGIAVPVLDVIKTANNGDVVGYILALNPQQSQDTLFALMNGKISLALNPYDSNYSAAKTEPTTSEAFVGKYINQNKVSVPTTAPQPVKQPTEQPATQKQNIIPVVRK